MNTRLMEWSAHHTTALWLLILACDVVYDVPSIPSVLVRAVNATNILVIAWLFVVVRSKHGSAKYCELCFREMVADGSDRAIRRRRTLRLMHYTTSRHGRWTLSIGLIVAMVFEAVATAEDWPVPLLILPFAVAVTTIQDYTISVHRPLQRWCPYCRRPDPVPPYTLARV